MGWWNRRLRRWQATPAEPPAGGWLMLSTVIAAVVTTAAIVYVVSMAPAVLSRLPLHYNGSASLPRGFYRPPFPDTLARGDLIRACLPAAHAPLALERRYLYPGLCPGGTEPLAKVVVALPGDTVHVDSTGTRVNGRRRVRAPVVRLDSKKRRVPALLGTRVLGDGECFVLSTYVRHSYDSRYFGPVDCSPPHVVLSAVDGAAQAAIDTMRRELVGK